MRLIRRPGGRFAAFAFAGTVGFVVDASVLYLVRDALGLYAGRGCSFTAAVLSTWLINRSLAFRDRRPGVRLAGEFAGYFTLMLVGAAANLGTYAVLLLAFPALREVPVVAVGAGGLAGMAINFLSSSRLLYRLPRRHP